MKHARTAYSEAALLFARAGESGVGEADQIALLKSGHLVLDEQNKRAKTYSMREAVSWLDNKFPDRNATVVIVPESGGCLFRAVDVQAVTEQVSTVTQGNRRDRTVTRVCFALCQDMAVNESACRISVWDYADRIQSPALPDEEHDRGLLKKDVLRGRRCECDVLERRASAFVRRSATPARYRTDASAFVTR
jgi:hypothetical protein